MIRPVLEYACPVWHSGLTVEHRNRIEAMQKRVFSIIFDTSDYLDFCTAHSYSILCMKGAICCVDSFSKACWTNPTAWTTCCLNCDQMVLMIDCATHPFLSCSVCALHFLSRLLLGLWSKRRQVKTAAPKRRQKWLCSKRRQTQTTPTVLSSSDAYIIDRRLYTCMACNR